MWLASNTFQSDKHIPTVMLDTVVKQKIPAFLQQTEIQLCSPYPELNQLNYHNSQFKKIQNTVM